MKTMLLTRKSPFQIFCANTLFEAGALDEVVFERGTAFPPKPMTLKRAAKRLREAASEFPARPARVLRRAWEKLRTPLYYGDRKKHEDRILGPSCRTLAPGLAVFEFGNLNSPEAAAHIRASGAGLIFVFGTGILKPRVFEGARAPFVNMHWGWSPQYRGEGIISALSTEGPDALGVTVHLLDPGIDSGDILYRARPSVDAEDNFYSIGLKLAKLGTGLFLKARSALLREGALSGQPQDLESGRLFTSAHLRERPELYARAWDALKAAGKK